MGTVKKYVCQYGDLDKLLDGTLKAEFQGLFPNPEVSEDKSAWRMYYGEFDLADFLDQFGIKYNSPRVRDAVAFDLVKLDDSSVSNDTEYTYVEHKVYSPLEYERFLMNKNFRVNLAKLEPEWSNLTFSGKPSDQGSDDDSSNLDDESSTSRTRTVDRVYQGVRMSKTLLSYFDSVFNNAFEDGEVKSGFDMSQIYVPFTNANDFTTEISLIPHTHPDFRAITSRAYYDKKYIQYKKLLKKYNITGIATFSLVDPDKDKNHTGRYLVKVQREINANKYDYIVATIDKDGKILSTPEVFKSTTNTILCVCQGDYSRDRELSTSSEVWTPVECDVPMVKSTTSSHYSVFRQRIPDYDLKLVRHYFQFKNRLEGMELCLWILERSIYMKEVQASECFAKETMVLHRLFQEFSKNKEIMELVKRYYDLIAEWDELVVKREQLSSIKDEKLQLLNQFLDEYNALGNNQLDKKLALGAKIQSLKLELDKRLKTSVIAINERLEKIREEVGEINAKIEEIYNRPAYGLTDEVKEKLKGTLADLKKAFEDDLTDEEKMEKGLVNLTDLKTHIANRANERKNKLGKPKVVPDLKNKPQSSINGLKQDLIDSTNGKLWNNYNIHFGGRRDAPPEHEAGGIHAIDTSELHKLILQSERWRGFMFSMGYELNQLKKMKTLCEDATIKVRRLVHNFEEKMADVESQVWDSNHVLRSDFSFTGIAASSLREIILLYDWYAANAPGKTYQEMGFEDEDQFLEFRRRCNKISFNLRKNQYAEMLSIKRDKLSNVITDLRNKIDSMNELKYHDKYGEEGAKEHREEDGWSVNDVTKEQLEYVEEQVKPGLGVEVERTAAMMAFTETQKARDEIKRIQMFNDAEQFLSKRVDEGIQVLTDELWQRRESAVRRLSDEINRISVFGVQDFQYGFDNSIGVLPQVNDVLDVFKDVELPSDFDRENVKALVGWMKKWHLRQNMGLSVFGGIYGELEDLQCAIQMRDCYRRGLDSGVNLFARMDGKIQLKPENDRYLDKTSDSGLDVFGNAEASIQFDPDIGIRLGSWDCGINLFSAVDKFIHIDSSSGVPIGGFLDSNLNLFTVVDGNVRVDGLLNRSLHKDDKRINVFGEILDEHFGEAFQSDGSVIFHDSLDSGLELFGRVKIERIDDDAASRARNAIELAGENDRFLKESVGHEQDIVLESPSYETNVDNALKWVSKLARYSLPSYIDPLSIFTKRMTVENRRNTGIQRIAVMDINDSLSDMALNPSDVALLVSKNRRRVLSGLNVVDYELGSLPGVGVWKKGGKGGIQVVGNLDSYISLIDEIPVDAGKPEKRHFNIYVFDTVNLEPVPFDMACVKSNKRLANIMFSEPSMHFGEANIQIMRQVQSHRHGIKSSSVDLFNRAGYVELGESVHQLVRKMDFKINVFDDTSPIQLDGVSPDGFIDDALWTRRVIDSRIRVFDLFDVSLGERDAEISSKNMTRHGIREVGRIDVCLECSLPYVPSKKGNSILVFHKFDDSIHEDFSSGRDLQCVDTGINIFTVNIPSGVDLNELRGRIGSVKMQQKQMGDRIGVFNANFDYINGELDDQLNRFVPRKYQLDGSIRVFDVHNDVSFFEPHTAYGIKERRMPVHAFDVESELKPDFDDALVDRRTFTGKIKVFDAYSLKDAISIQEMVNVEINRNSARTSSKVLILGAGDVSSVDDRQGIGSRVEQVKSKRKSHGDSMDVFDRLSHNGLIDINEAISRLYRIRKIKNAHEQSMVIFERTGLSGFTNPTGIMGRKESAEHSRIIRERGIVVFNTGVPDVLDENEIVSRKHMAIEHQRGLEQRLSAFDDSGLKLEHGGVNKAMDVIVESAQGSIRRINEFTSLDEYLAQKERVDRQYRVDQELMADRTISYLKGIGLITDVEDIEKMALRNRALQYEGDTSDKIFAIQDSKDNLDHAISVMRQQRESLQSIIDNLEQAESRIKKLTQENQRIFNACLLEKDRQNRNRLLLQKLENENQLMELRGIVKRIKKEHLEDFSELERMRSDVDDWQMKYNESVREFKEEIGLNQDTMNQLMIGIYNRWQDEILEQSEGK